MILLGGARQVGGSCASHVDHQLGLGMFVLSFKSSSALRVSQTTACWYDLHDWRGQWLAPVSAD
jgi:hypothetical protein